MLLFLKTKNMYQNFRIPKLLSNNILLTYFNLSEPIHNVQFNVRYPVLLYSFSTLCLDIFDQKFFTGQKFTKTDLFPLASVMVKVAQRLSTRINDDFMAHCGSKWLKSAKKLVETSCDFTPRYSSKCQLISVSGHCIVY